MKLIHFALSSLFVLACDSSGQARDGDNAIEQDADAASNETGVNDAGNDAQILPLDPSVPAPLRKKAACVELDSSGSTSFELHTNYFDVCGDTTKDADRAFTWTAPATGFYRAVAFPAAGSVRFELREGVCSEEANSVLACGEGIHHEGGETSSQSIFHGERGQHFTFVVDAAGNRFLETEADGFEPNSFSLSVEAITCPAQMSDTTLPATTALVFGGGKPTLHAPSCRETPSKNQRSVAFVAPEAGSYRFKVSDDAEVIRFPQTGQELSIALVAGTCAGSELDCAAATDNVQIVRELAEDEEVVVFVNTDYASPDEDTEVLLSVELIELAGDNDAGM